MLTLKLQQPNNPDQNGRIGLAPAQPPNALLEKQQQFGTVLHPQAARAARLQKCIGALLLLLHQTALHRTQLLLLLLNFFFARFGLTKARGCKLLSIKNTIVLVGLLVYRCSDFTKFLSLVEPIAAAVLLTDLLL